MDCVLFVYLLNKDSQCSRTRTANHHKREDDELTTATGAIEGLPGMSPMDSVWLGAFLLIVFSRSFSLNTSLPFLMTTVDVLLLLSGCANSLLGDSMPGSLSLGLWVRPSTILILLLRMTSMVLAYNLDTLSPGTMND